MPRARSNRFALLVVGAIVFCAGRVRADETYETLPEFAQTARDLIEKGKYDEAIEICNEAGRADATDSWPYVVRSKAYISQHEFPRAHGEVCRAIELSPERADAYVVRASCAAEMGKFDDAFADFSRAEELAPRMVKLFTCRAGVQLHSGNATKALEDFDRAIEIDANCVEALLGRGIANRELKRLQDAEADFTRAIELD